MKPLHVFAICTLFGPLILLSSCKRASPVEAAPLAVPQTAAIPAPTPAPLPPSLDGTYSDMKHVEGEGDMIGIEVTVSDSQGAALVTFQCAQGELPQPQRVAAQVTGNAVRFRARENSQCPAAIYTATVADGKLTLTRDTADGAGAGAPTPPEVLKRVSAPGQRPRP